MTEQTQTLPLEPMILPDAPSWFPLAWGWWVIIVIAMATIVFSFWLMMQKRQHAKAKQAALRLMKDSSVTPATAMQNLRQAALSYFPREQVASLQGERWYQFLDSQHQKSRFVDKQTQWEATLYSSKAVANSDELIEDCINWVTHALPPKKQERIVR